MNDMPNFKQPTDTEKAIAKLAQEWDTHEPIKANYRTQIRQGWPELADRIDEVLTETRDKGVF